MPTERELRWWVRSYDKRIYLGAKACNITQWYLAEGLCELRLRRQDRTHVMTLKSGVGLDRLEVDMDPRDRRDIARLKKISPIKVSFDRYRIGPFELDLLKGPLRKFTLLEREFGPDEPVDATLPAWVHEAVDVTNVLTKSVLARLAHVVGRDQPVDPEPFTAPVPILVISGGPGSGKSTTLDLLKKRFGDEVWFIPELARPLIKQFGFAPGGGPGNRRIFQTTLVPVQLIIENSARLEAYLKGVRLLVTDRGLLDSPAYLPGDGSEFEDLVRMRAKDLAARYAQVFLLGLPSREIYEAALAKDDTRSESYEEAVVLSHRLANAWRIANPIRLSPTGGPEAIADQIEGVIRRHLR